MWLATDEEDIKVQFLALPAGDARLTPLTTGTGPRTILVEFDTGSLKGELKAISYFMGFTVSGT